MQDRKDGVMDLSLLERLFSSKLTNDYSIPKHERRKRTRHKKQVHKQRMLAKRK